MHEELLPEGAIPVASILAQWSAMQQFYLAGGTSLALHLRHYQKAFSPRLFLQQLTYTQDLPDCDSALSLLVTPQSFDTVIHDLDIQVKTWTQRRFQPPPPSPRGPRL